MWRLSSADSPPALLNAMCLGVLISLTVTVVGERAVAFDDRVDEIMYQDPAFPELTHNSKFSDKLLPLWLQALDRPDSELQRMAADTIALAHRSGMQGLDDAVPRLVEVLQQEQLAPTVQRAVTNTLITLDATQAAKPLAETLDEGSLELSKLVEPALARWGYEPIQATWRERLANPETDRLRLLLAIQCLGIVKNTASLSPLTAIVQDENGSITVRLAAARAAAEFGGDDVVDLAKQLTSRESDQPTNGLLSVAILGTQSDSEAIAILQGLSSHKSATVRGLALRRLFEIDPTLLYDSIDSAILSTDVNIRRVCCETLVHKADAAAIVQLSPLLDDVNPGLRRYVSESLIQFGSQPSLREAVIQVTSDVVARDAWRGLEQGVIVLTILDYKPSAPRLLELLGHRRPEVFVSAAWGLRKLAVAETIPSMFTHAEQQSQRLIDKEFDWHFLGAIDLQLSQLFQAFGERDFRPAEPLMRTFVPKKITYAAATRAAAVWALGKLNEGTVDEALASLFAERLSDVSSMEPESDSVRRMSAIAIGRKGAKSQLDVLNEFLRDAPSPPGLACAWSLERITGEIHEFSFEHTMNASGWFLMPQRIRATGTD